MAPLPLAQAVKMYELYLNGYTCDEIYRINGGKIPFGQILDARVRYEWDKRKARQLDSIYANIEEKVVKTKNDSILHITDLLAAAHKVWGDKIKLFLQEGDASVLGGMDLSNMKTYKELLQMLQTLTANDKSSVKDVKVDGTVNHLHTVVNKKLTGEDATKLLESIDGEIIDG